MNVRKIGVLRWFWGESEGKLGSYGGFGLKVRRIGVLRWIWGKNEGKWGPEVVLG